MIHLEPVTQNNIEELMGLTVRKDQESYVSTVAESLAQAYVYSDNAYPFGVYEDDTLVGFIMMGYSDWATTEIPASVKSIRWNLATHIALDSFFLYN